MAGLRVSRPDSSTLTSSIIYCKPTCKDASSPSVDCNDIRLRLRCFMALFASCCVMCLLPREVVNCADDLHIMPICFAVSSCLGFEQSDLFVF